MPRYQLALLGVLKNNGECDICGVGVLLGGWLPLEQLQEELGVDGQVPCGVLLARTDKSTGEVDEDEADGKHPTKPSKLEAAVEVTAKDDGEWQDFPL